MEWHPMQTFPDDEDALAMVGKQLMIINYCPVENVFFAKAYLPKQNGFGYTELPSHLQPHKWMPAPKDSEGV